MKKEKVLLFIARTSMVLGVCALVYGLLNDEAWTTIIGGVLLVGQAMLEAYLDNLKDRNNPLSYKRKCVALSFILNNRVGTRDEFVEQFGVEMYEHFLFYGYIHEIMEEQEGKDELCWHTTKCGLRKGLEVN